MKKRLLILSIILFLIAGLASTGLTADGDITKVEVKPDVAKWKIDTVIFRAITSTAIVTYRKVDASDNPIGEVTVIFQNIPDDPETPGDETDNQFNQLITAINSGSNIKTTIGNAVKVKLGI